MIGLPGLRGRKVVAVRSADELDAMAAAGAVVAAALKATRAAAVPGASTLDLDRVAEAVIRDAGAIPSFLGYHGFPASICSSVNDRVVHGIPSADELLAAGDLVSIDCGAILDGFPRSVEQAEALREMLAKRNLELDAVLEFRVSEDELLQRLKSRGRADDTEEVILNRMKVYRDETAPLLDYYSHELKTVDAIGSLDEVFARALQALGK